MANLQLALQNQLKTEEDREANKKNLLTMELQPLETGLIDMSSDKIRSLTDYAVKKSTQKAVDLIKQKTGVDLLAKKKQLTDFGKNFVDTMNNHANEMIDTANDKIMNTLASGRDEVNNQLNRFHNMENPFHSVNVENMELPTNLQDAISIQPKSMASQLEQNVGQQLEQNIGNELDEGLESSLMRSKL